MRKIQTFLMAIMLGLFALSGCTPSSSGGGSTYYLKATVSGAPNMNSTLPTAAVVGTTLGISGTTISGGVGGQPIMALNIPHWSGGVGTTVFAPLTSSSTADEPFGQYTPLGSLSKMSKSGSVTITQVTATTITGTFEFTCEDGTAITNGTFNAQRY